MATGVVTEVDHDGHGLITPDSRGEPIRFNTDPDHPLCAGDRVSFLARITEAGVIADGVRRAHD